MDPLNSLALLFLSFKFQSRMRRQRNGYSDKDLEARGGIEPPNKGFADLCLTTWLPRRGRGNVFPNGTAPTPRKSNSAPWL